MPLYEYKCLKCGTVLEFLQKINDKPIKQYPNCKGPLEKVFSPPAIQFKGNGWYITDYAQIKKPEKERESEEKPKKGKEEPSKKEKNNQPSSTD